MAEICSSIVRANDVVIVELNSNYFNVINFILFDIVLASIVFYLTGDLAGLSNSTSALRQIRNRISAYNPPLVGVGLTCTRRNVYRLLAAVRAAVMVIVLATNFLIEGSSCAVVQQGRKNVLLPGPINASMDAGDLYRMGLRRRGCMGRNGSLTYYGELREDEGCELREELLTVPPVYFGLTHTNNSVTFREPCTLFTPPEMIYVDGWKCPGLGTVACRQYINLSTVISQCYGVVNVPDESGTVHAHYCQGEALFPGKIREGQEGQVVQKVSTNRIARCRLAMNMNVTDISWVPLFFNKFTSMRDCVEVVYGAGFKEMQVNFTSPDIQKSVSEVKFAWFALLGVTLFILAVLLFIDLFLRWKGHVPVANSEFGLGSLIANANNDDNYNPPVPIDTMDDEHEIPPQVVERTPLLYIQNRGGVLRARGV